MVVETVLVTPLFAPVGPELVVILGVLVLLFGADRIPSLARSVGESFGSFKKGKQEVEEELQEIEQETTEVVSDVKNDVESSVGEVDDSVNKNTTGDN